MIKILQHGNKIKEVTHTIQCPHCKCVFQFTESDCYHPKFGEYVIECPECHDIVDTTDEIL